MAATCAVSGLFLITSALGAAGQAHSASGFGIDLGRAITLVQPSIGYSAAALPDLGVIAPRLQGVQLASLRAASAASPRSMTAASLAASAGSSLISTPRVSGLAWRSGASCGQDGSAGWRGRALDVGFVEHDTWDWMYTRLRGGWFKSVVRARPARRREPADDAAFGEEAARRLRSGPVRLPLSPVRHAAGAGRRRARDRPARLGGEHRVGLAPLGIDSAGDIPNYKRCFQRLVRRAEVHGPGIKIEWTNGKKGKLPVSVLESYPGDSVVDVVGVHYYDNRPKLNSESAWAAMYNATINGGPAGHRPVAQGRDGAGQAARRARVGPVEPARREPQRCRRRGVHRPDASVLQGEQQQRRLRELLQLPALHQIYPPAAYPKASSRY
jgi:hypothetical protein